jgi:hypothetical protein
MKEFRGKCRAGPSDIGGHEDLYVHSFAGPTVILKCRTCHSFWTRKLAGDRSFDWICASGAQGILVPFGP